VSIFKTKKQQKLIENTTIRDTIIDYYIPDQIYRFPVIVSKIINFPIIFINYYTLVLMRTLQN